MSASFFLCPVCGGPLFREGNALRCPQGHSYDRSAAGYVHLLPANRMHSRAPGDDRDMAAARSRFLSGGWYDILSDRLAALCLTLGPRDPALLDSGCGEGHYTRHLARALRDAGQNPRVAGIDISKESVRRAAKRDPDTEYAVASAYALPVPDGAADILLNCFSPLALSEFRRVTKPGGLFLYVVPGPRHLWEMKTLLYDSPYPNPEQETPYEGFSYLDIVPLETRLTLPSRETIADLFAMTPYFWKTPRAGRERLAAAETLDLTVQFRIHVFRRTADASAPQAAGAARS